MFKTIIHSAIISAALSVPALAQETVVKDGTLAVTGRSSVSVENTAAKVNFGVQVQAPTSAEAVSRNTRLLTDVFEAVAEHGIKPEDMQTSNISLHQINDRHTQHITGYRMNNRVSIHVSDIAKLGDILTAATDAGINRIDGVQMVPAKDAVDQNELRRLAAEDARAKATLYADSLGLEITGILSVAEQVIHRPQPYQMDHMMAAKAESMPIAGGSSEAGSSLHVTYKVQLSE
jgi:uncharacterized protein